MSFYTVLLGILLGDLLYMVANFKYSFYMCLKEREASHITTDIQARKKLNDEIYAEYGMFRFLVKTYIYTLWFIFGFFTQFWVWHLGIFIFNYLQEINIQGKLKFTKVFFIAKLFAYLSLYSILLTLIIKG